MGDTTDPAAAGHVTVAGRRTPMVLSVARCLREGLGRGVPMPADTTPRTVSLVSTSDAQRAHLTFNGSDVVVSADALSEAQLTWEVSWSNPIPAAVGDDDFAQAVAALLADGDVDWRSAADSFWATTGAQAGMPTGLYLFCADDASEAVIGELQPDGQGLMGTARALSDFFRGRATAVEVLEGGELGINLSFPVFSALFGANIKVVCGEL